MLLIFTNFKLMKERITNSHKKPLLTYDFLRRKKKTKLEIEIYFIFFKANNSKHLNKSRLKNQNLIRINFKDKFYKKILQFILKGKYASYE